MIVHCCLFADTEVVNGRGIGFYSVRRDGIVVYVCKFCSRTNSVHGVVDDVQSGKYDNTPRSLWEDIPF